MIVLYEETLFSESQSTYSLNFLLVTKFSFIQFLMYCLDETNGMLLVELTTYLFVYYFMFSVFIYQQSLCA